MKYSFLLLASFFLCASVAFAETAFTGVTLVDYRHDYYDTYHTETYPPPDFQALFPTNFLNYVNEPPSFNRQSVFTDQHHYELFKSIGIVDEKYNYYQYFSYDIWQYDYYNDVYANDVWTNTPANSISSTSIAIVDYLLDSGYFIRSSSTNTWLNFEYNSNSFYNTETQDIGDKYSGYISVKINAGGARSRSTETVLNMTLKSKQFTSAPPGDLTLAVSYTDFDNQEKIEYIPVSSFANVNYTSFYPSYSLLTFKATFKHTFSYKDGTPYSLSVYTGSMSPTSTNLTSVITSISSKTPSVEWVYTWYVPNFDLITDKFSTRFAMFRSQVSTLFSSNSTFTGESTYEYTVHGVVRIFDFASLSYMFPAATAFFGSLTAYSCFRISFIRRA